MTIQSKIRNLNIRGQAFVEFAFILPILLLLVFGIAEFGRFLYLKNSATNAAREGARAGVVSSSANYAADITTAATRILAITTPGLSIIPDPLTAPGPNIPVNVTVRMSFNSVVPKLIPLFENLTSIRASATMRRE